MKPEIKLSEFSDRLVTLNTGAVGLRGGLRCEVKGTDDDHCLDFIGSDGRVDRYNEVIEQTGWQLENFRRNPVIPDCHNYDTVARILGRAERVEVKDGKLCNRVRFAMDNPLGAMAFKMAKAGFIPAQSVGFIPLEWKNGVGRDEPDRTYNKCELLEISLVVVPANPGATMTLALKSGAIERSDLTAVADYFKQFCSNPKEDTERKARASAPDVDYAQLLAIGRSTVDALKHT